MIIGLKLDELPHPIKIINGKASWVHMPGDKYIATGVDRNGKRLGSITSSNWIHIHGINLYRGSKWLLRGGKRYLICRVNN